MSRGKLIAAVAFAVVLLPFHARAQQVTNMETTMPTLTRPKNIPQQNKEILGAYIKEHREALAEVGQQESRSH